VGVAEVGVSGGADHDDGSGWVFGVVGECVLPVSFGFELVVALASGVEVAFAGGSCGPGDDVVELAFAGGSGAVGGAAGDVPGADEVG